MAGERVVGRRRVWRDAAAKQAAYRDRRRLREIEDQLVPAMARDRELSAAALGLGKALREWVSACRGAGLRVGGPSAGGEWSAEAMAELAARVLREQEAAAERVFQLRRERERLAGRGKS